MSLSPPSLLSALVADTYFASINSSSTSGSCLELAIFVVVEGTVDVLVGVMVVATRAAPPCC